jgi:hypothetical protein
MTLSTMQYTYIISLILEYTMGVWQGQGPEEDSQAP